MNNLTRISFILLFTLAFKTVSAQIGINTLQPDTNAVLDIHSSDKGVKIPQIADTSVSKPSGSNTGYLLYHKQGEKYRSWNGRYWETVNPLDVDNKENVTAPGNVNIQGILNVAGKSKFSDSLINRNGVILGNKFTGNGADITNVNAAQLQSHPANYFGTTVVDDTLQARIDRLNANKLNKGDFYPTPFKVTLSTSGNTSLGATSNVECLVLGRMVYIRGYVIFTKSVNNENGAGFVLSGIPDFPSCFGCNAFTYNLVYNWSNNDIGYGYYDKSSTVGNQNTVLFYRVGGNLTSGVTWLANFQFFYWY